MHKHISSLFDPINSHVSYDKKVFHTIQNHHKNNCNIYLFVSGGPDSMYMTYMMYSYMLDRWLDTALLHIIHINHAYRKESNDEQKMIEHFFSSVWCTIYTYSWKDHTERWRRQYRQSIMQNIANNDPWCLFVTWHNLSDRVETTFLHLLRGCRKPWIVNMSTYQHITCLITWLTYGLFRPLLYLSKQDIYSLCSEHMIPYYTDPSNQDISLSQRNKIRKLLSLVYPIWQESISFYGRWKMYYDRIENKKYSSSLSFTQHTSSIYRTWCWTYVSYRLLTNEDEVYLLLDNLWALSGISSRTIWDIFHIYKKRSWRKYINGWYLFATGRKNYALYYPKKQWQAFWKEYVRDSIVIDTLWTYSIWDFSFVIDDIDDVWATIRYPVSGDIWKKKRVKKHFINNHIPLFRRNIWPIYEKSWMIYAIHRDKETHNRW